MQKSDDNHLPDTIEAWGAALDGEAVTIEDLMEQREAAKIALERKPRGKKARAFYRYVAALVAESDNLREIEEQAARDRQIEIGNELDRYKYPAANNGTEYNTAQDSGLIIDRAKRGGEYYPEAQRLKDEKEANKIQAEDLQEGSESAENSGSLKDDLPW